MSKDNFCIVPWIHLNTEPNGRVKPCCASTDHFGHLQDSTLEEIWNNDSMKSMRRDFIENKIPSGCQTCILKEDSGGISYREAITKRFSHHVQEAKTNTALDGTYNKFQMLYWDFRFSNICNFKCRMCGHGCSSTWWDDFSPQEKKFKVKFFDSDYYQTDLMQYVDRFMDDVEEIYFAGGEPLLMTEHYQILDKLIAKERYDVNLRYNTNMSTLKYKDYDLIDIWKRFKTLKIFASIDGVDGNAEYSRAGTNWPKVEGNLKQLSESGVDYVVSTVINIFSVFNFTELIDRLIALEISTRKILVSNLHWPKYYATSILPTEIKEKLKNSLLEHLEQIKVDVNEVEHAWLTNLYAEIVFSLMIPISEEQQLSLQRKFKTETVKIDTIRQEDITLVIPEIAEWYNKL